MKLIHLNNYYNWKELVSINTTEQWLIDIQLFLINWHDNSDHIVVPTSGSTGKPKLIKLPKSDIRKSARTTNNYFNLNNSKTALLCLPSKYIAGKLMIIRSLEAGMNLMIEKPTTKPLQHLNINIDFVAMTPMQVENVFNCHHNKLNLINTIIIGGGFVSQQLSNKLQNTKCACYQTYGMTETITHLGLQSINGNSSTNYFKLLDGFNIEKDNRGCLVVSAEHIYNQRVITNDLVDILDPKTFKWLGRYDNVINTGGVKVHPEVIESKIQSLIDNPFFIIGIDDKLLGQKVTLCIETKSSSHIDKVHLLNQIESRLSKFEFPRSILLLDCFLYTETGKIRRKATVESH